MAIASLVAVVDAAPEPVVVNGKELLEAPAVIAGATPVALTVRCAPGSQVATPLQDSAKSPILISGELILDDDGSRPIVFVNTFCPATAEQYLNSVLMCGHIGGEAKAADSGKSCRRSIAVNRFAKKPDSEEFEQLTDWYKIRAFGFLKDRLTAFPVGGLIEVAGALEQMSSASGTPYCEVKARSIRLHKGRKSANNPAKGTAAVGYEQSDFEGSADDMPIGDW